MTEFEFASAAIDPDDGWLEVWPVGVALGTETHLRSWPAFASIFKANEYLDGLGRFKKMRRIVDVQEDLQHRYELMQQEAWSVPPTDIARAVKLAPLRPGTVFSKETVRADYLVMFGVHHAQAPLGLDAAQSLSRGGGGRDVAALSTSSVLGHPAVFATVTDRDDSGALLAAWRTVIIAPVEHPVYVELQLRSNFEQAAASIDETLADILTRAEFAETAPS